GRAGVRRGGGQEQQGARDEQGEDEAEHQGSERGRGGGVADAGQGSTVAAATVPIDGAAPGQGSTVA
ncbi:MAG TPA: hypothetical protein VNT55_06720, partial [Baekduia sp.]|nr:hypothetical protein [Baekduia sp.]